jgi:predicted TIM-barrel fold metal-dependent hydrolase
MSTPSIIDVHCGWGPTPAAPAWNDRATVCAALLQRGIGGAFLSSLLARRYDPVAGNDSVATALEAESDDGCDLRGWLVAHPGQLDDASAQMRAQLYSPHFVGMALYPDPISGRPVTLEAGRELFTVFRRYGKPLLIEALDADAMAEAVAIAAGLTGIKVIVSGMGGDEWRRSIDLASRPVNLFFDISGTLASEKIAYARTVCGARKLLFASGAPGTDPAAILGMLDEVELTADEREKILAGNAQRLFELGGGTDIPAAPLAPLGA